MCDWNDSGANACSCSGARPKFSPTRTQPELEKGTLNGMGYCIRRHGSFVTGSSALSGRSKV